MHHIKHQARKHAWYASNDADTTKTYNPFARTGPRRARGDEENNLTHISTENDVNLPATESRRAQYDEDTAAFRGPQKAGTYPQSPSGAYPVGSRGLSSDETEKTDDARPDMYNPVSRESDDGPRQRKGGKFLGLFHKKNKDLERSDTEKSKKRKHKHIPFMTQVKAVLFSWVNILLVFVPIGIALEQVHSFSRVGVFVLNFVAIIPLAGILSFATEELAMYIGEVLGGLLNASFGNAVELIVSVIALKQGKVLIVQTSLIGSMLSNLLLVLGMCFFFGGINRTEQYFNITVAQTAASLLALAIGSLIIPTAFQIFSQGPDSDRGVAPTSRGTSVLLLVVYACYLLFQLRTHKSMYNEPSQKTAKRSSGKKDPGEAQRGIAMIGAASGAATAGGDINRENLVHEAEEEEETPSLSVIGSLVTLAVATVLIAFCAEYMVSGINSISQSVSQEFIGLILIPIVGNAAEHATAVTVAIKDKMDLAIGVAVGSSLQIALLVLPLMVMLNWWGVGDQVLTLDFDGFLVVVLVLSIWLVNYLINDGKSHWLEGVMLMLLYMIIAIAAWFYPAQGEVAG